MDKLTLNIYKMYDQWEVKIKFAILPKLMSNGKVIWLRKYKETRAFYDIRSLFGDFSYWETISRVKISPKDV